MDSAFFSDEIVTALDEEGVDFTISVPFERFVELKTMIEGATFRWRRFGSELAFFEPRWKPKSWKNRFRFLFVRHEVKVRDKEPIQLDLFIPAVTGFDFKVIVTNKRARPKKILAFHNGRGAQEAVFAELKSQCQMDYVPVRTRVGQSALPLLRHPRPQPRSRVADAGRAAPASQHHREAVPAVDLRGNSYTAPKSPSARRTSHSSSRPTHSCHERQQRRARQTPPLPTPL